MFLTVTGFKSFCSSAFYSTHASLLSMHKTLSAPPMQEKEEVQQNL